MDTNPNIIAGHLILGDAISRTEQYETRAWNARNRGLYVSEPEQGSAYIPASERAKLAAYVCLEIVSAGLGVRE